MDKDWREPNSSNKAGGKLLVRPGNRVSLMAAAGRAGGNGELNSQAALVCVAVAVV